MFLIVFFRVFQQSIFLNVCPSCSKLTQSLLYIEQAVMHVACWVQLVILNGYTFSLYIIIL